MGQYWYPVNLDKREFVRPHALGVGLKLWEQLANHPGTGGALLVLCAAMPEPRGGGDFHFEAKDGGYEEIARRTIGRWAGDRIALVGDYAVDTDLAPEHEASKIYGRCMHPGEDSDVPEAERYRDVTADVARVIEHELGGKFVGEGWKTWKEGK